MSKNYYLDFHPHMGDSLDVIIRFHVGKSTNGDSSISMFCGKHFPDVQSWKSFITHNELSIEITTDSVGETLSAKEFLEKAFDFKEESTQKLLQELKSAERRGDSMGLFDHTVYRTPQPMGPNQTPRWWLDESSGALFYGGDFC